MAEFGYHTIGGSTDNPSNNVIWAKATTTPGGGTLTKISIHCDIAIGTPQVNCALYSDSAGAPNALLASGTAQTVNAGFGWIDVPVSVALVNGTQYWFAYLVPGGGGTADINVHFDAASGTELYFKSNGIPGGSTFPATQSGATSDNTERISIYGTYTPTSDTQEWMTRSAAQQGPRVRNVMYR